MYFSYFCRFFSSLRRFFNVKTSREAVRLKTLALHWMELFIYRAGHFQDVVPRIASLRSRCGAAMIAQVSFEKYFQSFLISQVFNFENAFVALQTILYRIMAPSRFKYLQVFDTNRHQFLVALYNFFYSLIFAKTDHFAIESETNVYTARR